MNPNIPKEKILEAVKKHKTPFHIYDEVQIRENAKRFKKSFSILPGFKEFFAVKALPNPFILKILKEEGFGADCSSMSELMLSEKAGITGENIMFSSNDTAIGEFKKAKELGGIINLDDINMIESLEKEAGIPELVCFRYNPGPLRQTTKENFIGNPEDAKYGLTKKQLMEAYKICKEKGVKRFGLHTMVVSNELNADNLILTSQMLFDLVTEIKKKLGIDIEFVNLGGGIGTPYKPEEKEVSYDEVAKGIKKAYDEKIVKNGLTLRIFYECGRVITGPYGWLITKVIHMKHIYKDFVGCDANLVNLMRPAVYGAYHHITVLGKEGASHKYDVTGSLCENNDKFAVDRMLPEIEVGDVLAIHNTGAHGHSMGSNYNGKLRSAEVLLREDGSLVEIRRAETVEDLFSTLDFKKLGKF